MQWYTWDSIGLSHQSQIHVGQWDILVYPPTCPMVLKGVPSGTVDYDGKLGHHSKFLDAIDFSV